MYVVSVSGPKMYGADNSNWVENGAVQRKMLTNTQLWQVISVEGDKLTYKAKTATGRLHDQFTINKPTGQAKIITEDLANVKEEGVGGVVPGTLSLSLAAAPSLGAFTPGVAKDYEAGVAATITVLGRRRDAVRRRPVRDQRGQARQRHVRARAADPGRRRRRLRGGQRLAAGAAQLQRPDRQRPGDDPLQAGHRRQRGAAHGRLQQGAHAHAVDDLAVTPPPTLKGGLTPLRVV